MKVSWGESKHPPDARGCLVCLLTATSTRKPPLSAAQHAARRNSFPGTESKSIRLQIRFTQRLATVDMERFSLLIPLHTSLC
ncbi:rCG63325 [Rattus norvegicus]|uniref:RCG63325 n=1 Tax=Rattus norvegicus TaxID=10116 RepID=A6JRM9_RAT|nr:rCG63325 [Rattus norvegicus]